MILILVLRRLLGANSPKNNVESSAVANVRSPKRQVRLGSIERPKKGHIGASINPINPINPINQSSCMALLEFYLGTLQ